MHRADNPLHVDVQADESKQVFDRHSENVSNREQELVLLIYRDRCLATMLNVCQLLRSTKFVNYIQRGADVIKIRIRTHSPPERRTIHTSCSLLTFAHEIYWSFITSFCKGWPWWLEATTRVMQYIRRIRATLRPRVPLHSPSLHPNHRVRGIRRALVTTHLFLTFLSA